MANAIDMYSHLAGQALRAGWYLGLHEAMDRATDMLGRDLPRYRPQGPVPTSRALLADLGELLLADARNVRDGIYASPRGEDGPALRQLMRTVAMFADLPEAMRRRRAGDGHEVARRPDSATLPDYFTQNFHYQTGGYLTDQSARLYDTQVETLFLGAANAMRRQALRPIAEYVRGKDQRHMRCLDVACGTGRFLHQLGQVFPAMELEGLDLSAAYLSEARRFLRGRRRLRLINANAEHIPSADDSLDIVSCIFLFHELPAEVRRRVAAEIARVLKPGGLLVFIDSLQMGDKPDFDGLLEAFPAKFHEPYYANYLNDDVVDLFAEPGLELQSWWTAFLSKVVVCRKPTGSKG